MKSYPKQKRIKLKPHAWEKLKKECFERDDYKCRSCGREFSEHYYCLDAHHILNRSQGGSDTLKNLVSVCCHPFDCHHKITVKLLANDFVN